MANALNSLENTTGVLQRSLKHMPSGKDSVTFMTQSVTSLSGHFSNDTNAQQLLATILQLKLEITQPKLYQRTDSRFFKAQQQPSEALQNLIDALQTVPTKDTKEFMNFCDNIADLTGRLPQPSLREFSKNLTQQLQQAKPTPSGP